VRPRHRRSRVRSGHVRPPDGVNSTALFSRLTTTCSSRVTSPCTHSSSPSTSTMSSTPARSAASRIVSAARATTVDELEHLEHLRSIFGRDAASVVADCKHRRVIVRRRDLDDARPGGIEALQRVADDVGEDLANGIAAAAHHRQWADLHTATGCAHRGVHRGENVDRPPRPRQAERALPAAPSSRLARRAPRRPNTSP
jgi:hypothetical protein